MKKHYETHVEDTDNLISVAGPELDYKSWYEQYRKLMEEQAQRKYGLYTPTSEGDDDDFPSIPGMIARYSAKGLTNEEMSKNPVWKDLMDNGYDLQMKNFAWSGMSGVGGYVQNFNNFGNNLAADKVRIDERNSNSIKITILITGIGNTISIKKSAYQFNKSYFIKISSEGYNEGDLSLLFYATLASTATTVKVSLNPNGITEIPAIKEDDFLAVFINVGGKVGSLTIEQLPLYPGFIIGDGVDDYAVTEKNLDFEDTYTVYTAFIPFQEDPARNMVLCGKNNTKDFYMNYSTLNSINFYSSSKAATVPLNNGFNLIICKRTTDKMIIKNLLTNVSIEIDANAVSENPGLYYLWRSLNNATYANAAIAGQVICNGHFTTDEEDTKVLNWYKKEYPWLFFDQAWTVVGKSNEDTNRATIANITGNGNDLVLSNFAFSGNSGYGLYGENYNGGRWVKSTDRADITWTSYSVNITSVKVASTQLYYQSYPEQPSFTVPSYKIKVYGLKDGQTLSYKQATSEGQQIYKIPEDGIYTLPSFPFKANGDWYGFTLNKVQESCDITIEQIPEYEGYLVTDGVDDKITSSVFTMGKDFTIVGDWKLLTTIAVNAGIVKPNSLLLFNRTTGISLFINSITLSTTILNIKSLKAICSDGRIYLNDWSEMRITNEQSITSSTSILSIGFNGNNYTQVAFKNLGIYDSCLLSKEDCIKSYIYLQTLKAK